MSCEDQWALTRLRTNDRGLEGRNDRKPTSDSSKSRSAASPDLIFANLLGFHGSLTGGTVCISGNLNGVSRDCCPCPTCDVSTRVANLRIFE